MNTNATMFNRLVAVFLDLITYIGYICGILMLTSTALQITTKLNFRAESREDLLKYFGIFVLGFFILDILFVRIFATTPGKLCVNCDVDFHTGNTILHCFLRSFIKVLCLFTVVPGIFSYVSASGDYELRSFHDRATKTNVTNTTRTPRFLGAVIVILGVGILIYFIYKYK